MVRNVNVSFCVANRLEPDDFSFTKSKVFGMRSKVFGMRSIVNDKPKIATEKERKIGWYILGFPCVLSCFSHMISYQKRKV